MNSETSRPADLRDFLAAERTFLAWIRTGLALMGFGFVVARFGLFLQQLRLIQHDSTVPATGVSLWFGTALIVLGVVVNVFSAWHHKRLVRDLNRGVPPPPHASTQAVIVALILALVGLCMAVYLISGHVSATPHHDNLKETSMVSRPSRGIIDLPSKYSVDEVVDRLKSILQSKGVHLFATIDHSGEAEKVGMKIPPTKLLIFGNPKAGTPLMLAEPHSAIDLPLKILIWEDGDGKVWVSYNSPAYLQERYNLSPELIKNVAVIETLASQTAQ